MLDQVDSALDLVKRDGIITVTIPLIGLLFLVLLILLQGVVVWSLKRRRDPHFSYREDSGFDRLLPSLVGMTHGDLISGNRYQILPNGTFFSVLLEELRNARRSINFETYLWKKGQIASTIVDLMIQKAREGVEVRLLVDASGGSGVGVRAWWKLKRGGVRLERYRPIRFANLGWINNRDHRKIIVVDGRIGFLGGHCIVDSWLGDAEDKQHFRDLSVRVEGPIVNRLQACFTENWIEECGEVLAGERFFPQLEPVGNIAMHLAYITATGSTSALELLHYLAIHAARDRITIQNPYFLPDPEMIEAIIDAVKRGVKVRVMLPAAQASDHSIVQHASHHHFGTLLKKGVRIFEYQKTLLHQKVITVDGVWSAIGSTNFDDRSFELNDEVSLGVYDPGLAAEMERIFEEDLKFATECQFDSWSRRGLLHKLTDGSAFLINEQL